MMNINGNTRGPAALFSGAINALVSLVSGVLAAVLLLYSGYVLYDGHYTQTRALAAAEELRAYKPEIIEDERVPLAGADLGAINADYRAWLTIDGTLIDYPVAQGEDDLYYASHDIFGESSLSGAIYLSAHCAPDLSDAYSVIYGHHMDNGAMFGALDGYRSQEFFDAHRSGTLTCSSAVYDLRIFAVIETNAYDGAVYGVDGKSAAQVAAYAENCGGRMIFSSDCADAEKIVAMSTCAAAETNGRLVVFAAAYPHAAPAPDEDEVATPDEPDDPALPEESEEQEPAVPEDPDEEIEPDETPLAVFTEELRPTGGSQTKAWALVNVLCTALAIYVLVPVAELKTKFGRGSVKGGRFIAGMAVEVIAAAACAVITARTLDLKTPMVLIDSMTPVMLALAAVVIGADMLCVRRAPGSDKKR